MKKREGHEILIHELKSDPAGFIEMYNGNKQAEIRLNDRLYEVDDYILLRQTQWSSEDMKRDCQLVYTGRHLLFKIIHVQDGYGLKDGHVSLSVRKLD